MVVPVVTDKSCILVYNNVATMSFQDIHLTFRFLPVNGRIAILVLLHEKKKQKKKETKINYER